MTLWRHFNVSLTTFSCVHQVLFFPTCSGHMACPSNSSSDKETKNMADSWIASKDDKIFQRGMRFER